MGEDETVVEVAGLPKMTTEAIEMAGKAAGEHMPEDPQLVEGISDEMAPLPPPAEGRELMDPPAGEQQPGTRPVAGDEGYVRIRLQVDGDRLVLVGARAVEGPLAQPASLHAGLAYEVRVRDRRVAVDTLPASGQWRSFPAPDAPVPEMRAHHITEVPSYEVTVRVPRDRISVADLPNLRVDVFRTKEDPSGKPIGPAPVAAQFQRELRAVARLDGVQLEELPEELQNQLREALE